MERVRERARVYLSTLTFGCVVRFMLCLCELSMLCNSRYNCVNFIWPVSSPNV